MRKKHARDAAESLAGLPGLGPRSAAALQAIGIASVAALRRRDPFEVYARLKAAAPGTSLNFLYALIGALEGIHWQEIKRARRTAILLRLEEMGLAPK